MILEIGSEFEWLEYSKEPQNEFTNPFVKCDDYAFAFSGRTAIEIILKDLRNKNINKIAFPSYCCYSMIAPCLKLGIKFVFYDVFYNGALIYDFKKIRDCDVVFLCNYFGYRKGDMYNELNYYKKKGAIIIEDITHSLLSKEKCCDESDYYIASIRKWFPILSGGFCGKKKGNLVQTPTDIVPEEYIVNKMRAMRLKEHYLKFGDILKKEQFLYLYNYCNDLLANNYSNISIDEVSLEILSHLDYEKIRERRIANSKNIHQGLNTNRSVSFLFSEKDIDCPLFVPIVFENREKREEARRMLIESEIYCPIHWPKPNFGCVSNLYDLELSLICDQRYGEKDMQKLISIISNIF